mmetsp:Transcript_27989/g.70837  ORF Transcript_27989/g.70837 Transcript_27989/m.70837 type:complete len:673 (+) Transcript_27989:133-2151(+)|eukprot:CAMPEP_0178997736 /NCGR_PEP_ID=MMETSP0795-20121207/9123_1 /TAXON_ID=88552 /ORGANISM="Amoebophrya sp., Strain Ameob2" /LENGTH=672 /DNA_ID=CAMNT_0020690337 /DNA_START=161 /DNA_END=2179 /DNA_ORIENTATION=-
MLSEALSAAAQSRRRVLSIQSHVVHGYVGNKSAIFPLQLLNFDVDPVNSVHFSNHTGYPSFSGDVLSPDQLWKIYESLRGLEKNMYSHVLTGYIGSKVLLSRIAKIVADLRERSPDLIYVCDPVLGDNGKFYAPQEMVAAFVQDILPLATILTPNQFECEVLAAYAEAVDRREITTLEDACRCVDLLHSLGPQHVFVTSLDIFEGYVTMLYSKSGPPVSQTAEGGDDSSPASSVSSSGPREEIEDLGNGKWLLKLPTLHYDTADVREQRGSSRRSGGSSATSSEFSPEKRERASSMASDTSEQTQNQTGGGPDNSSTTAAETPQTAKGSAFTGTGDLTAALFLAHSFDNPCELPYAMELVAATMQAVLSETARSGSARRIRFASAAGGGGSGAANGATTTVTTTVKVVPPEIRLIQSKKHIESPPLKRWPSCRPEKCLEDDSLPMVCQRVAGKLKVKAVCFDMDGTLTVPHQIDFRKMREQIGAPKGVEILEYVEGLPDKADRRAAHHLIEQMELDACYTLQPDAVFLLKYLKKKGYKVGLITRNHAGGVKAFERELHLRDNVEMEKVENPPPSSPSFSFFDGVRTRDDASDKMKPKPSGDMIRDLCAKEFGGVDPEKVLMVGDHPDDVKCGEDAGSWTCEIFSPVPHPPVRRSHCGADFHVSTLTGLLRFL